MLRGRHAPGWAAGFLATTLATCITGFLFPFERALPSHVVGVITLAALAGPVVALATARLTGPWRWVYVTGSVLALYLNVFVGVVQMFLKIPALHALAPTQTEPAFVAAQGIVLLLFIAVGFVALRRFHPQAVGVLHAAAMAK